MRILIQRLSLFALFLSTTVSTFAEDALDRWYFRDARVVNKVRFVGALFIGVGNNGTILTSLDGQTWTARNSGTSASLRGIAFGNLGPVINNLYVVVGASGTILISSNAVNWTSVGATTADLNDVAYVFPRFVAVTTRTSVSQPNALRTSDGTTWSDVFFPDGAPAFPGSIFYTATIAPAGTLLFAAGARDSIANSLWRSADGGQNWQNIIFSQQATMSIAYGNGRVIAVGSEGTPTISTNFGTSWIFPEVTNICPVRHQCSFGTDTAFGNRTFVCVRDFYVANGLLTTTNGESWSKRSALTGLQMNSVAFGNGTFVAAGQNGIYQSEPVSTPGLSIWKNSSSNAVNITVTGEVGRAYRLQTSTNLANWYDHSSFTNNAPTMEFVAPITNALQLYFRAITP